MRNESDIRQNELCNQQQALLAWIYHLIHYSENNLPSQTYCKSKLRASERNNEISRDWNFENIDKWRKIDVQKSSDYFLNMINKHRKSLGFEEYK